MDDIKRLKAELEEAKAEARFAQALLDQVGEAAEVGTWDVDLQTQQIYWNATNHRLHGTDPETYQPNFDDGMKYVADEHKEFAAANFKELVENGTRFSHDLLIRRQDTGEQRWVRVVGMPGRVDGKIVRVYGTFQDIHAEKTRELERQREEARMRILFTTFRFGFWDLNVRTGELTLDDSMLTLFGLVREELTGTIADWKKNIHSEDLADVETIASTSIQTGGMLNTLYRIVVPNGEIRWIKGHGLVSRDQTGNPQRMWGISIDVTQEMESQDRLKMLEALVEASPDIFGIAGKRGEVFYLNKAARDLGWSDTSAFGDIFPLESIFKYLTDIFPVLKTKGRWQGEVMFRDNVAGEEFPVMQTSFLLRDVKGKTKAVATIASDLREKKRLEAELEDRRLKMIQNAKMSSLGEMAAGMAHEINNPLAIIKGNASLLQLHADEKELDGPRLKKSLETIDHAIERIALIIKGLRSFARDPSKDPQSFVSLVKLLESTSLFCQARFQSSGIALEIDKPLEDLRVTGRETELAQALMNLVMNAFDAARSEATGWVKLDCVVKEKDLMIRVSNSGPRIPKDIQDKIMEPFFTTKPVGQGTGLGLSISRGIAHAHGGELWLDKEMEHTTFVLQLPLAT